jgi:stage V sporulation protein AF
MRRLCEDYRENVQTLCRELRTRESFDVLVKTVKLPDNELTLFFIDGFTKDTVIQKLIVQLTMSKRTDQGADEFLYKNVSYIEADVSEELDTMITAVLSGSALLIGSSFGAKAIIIDTRTYPARET